MFPCISEFGMTSEQFATELLNTEKLAVVPGTAFGDCGEGFIRISYAYSLENLKEAMNRMEAFITGLRNRMKTGMTAYFSYCGLFGRLPGNEDYYGKVKYCFI